MPSHPPGLKSQAPGGRKPWHSCSLPETTLPVISSPLERKMQAPEVFVWIKKKKNSFNQTPLL